MWRFSDCGAIVMRLPGPPKPGRLEQVLAETEENFPLGPLRPDHRIFLRKVLRLRPSRSAARIWFPRVAASAAVINGSSILRSTRV